jgi:hypothetical protein
VDSKVVRLGTLEEFTSEGHMPPSGEATSLILSRPTVRLHLFDGLTNGHGLPAKILELHLQGLNDSGEILWLMKSREISWLPDRGPATPQSNGPGLTHQTFLPDPPHIRGGGSGLCLLRVAWRRACFGLMPDLSGKGDERLK